MSAATLKRVKAESDATTTPAAKKPRAAAADGDAVVTPDDPPAVGSPPEESQVEVDRVQDAEAAARARFEDAAARGDVIDIDECSDDDAAPAPFVHDATTAPAEVVVKAEKWAAAREASAQRAAAERAYETRVWAGDRAPEAPAGEGRTAVVDATCVVTAAEASALSVGQPARGDALKALCDASEPLAALIAADRPNVVAAVAVVVSVAPQGDDEVAVAVRAQATIAAAMINHRGGHLEDGHAGLAEAVGSVLRASGAVALDQKTAGLCLPPRAARADFAALRQCDGLLDALETEGTAATARVDGLLENVELGDYQRESVAFMLARERSPRSLEDLFVSDLTKDLAAVSLPAPRFRRDWPKGGGAEAERAAQRGLADVKTYFARPPNQTHRGGILAEDMGLGKTLEVLALVLAHAAPPEWLEQKTIRAKATLVVLPPALLGQWRHELRHRAPALKAEEFDSREDFTQRKSTRAADVVLCAYADAAALAASNVEWWRIVLDEPHAHLTVRPKSFGKMDISPAVEACQMLAAPHRWCLTGTPFSNSLFDVLGQLVFLRLVPRLLSVNYFRCLLANNYLSPFNSAAEVMATILKPLLVRHSKNAERDGARLVALPPLEERQDTVVSVPSSAFDQLVAAKRRAPAVAPVHAAAQALKPLEWLCAGVEEKTRLRHDSVAGASRLDELPVAMPRREDAEATAETVASQDLHAFRRELEEGLRLRGGERRCVCCLKPNVGALAPRAPTCGHLFCGDCVESLFEKAKSTSDTVEGVAYEVPEDQRKEDDVVRDRPWLVVTGDFPENLQNYRDAAACTDALKRLFAPHAGGRASNVDVRLDVGINTDPRARVALSTRAMEEAAAAALDGTPAEEAFPGAKFGPAEPEPIRVARPKRTVASVVCPACSERFVAEEVLDLEADVLAVPNGGRWSASVRNFVLANSRRRAAARKRAVPEKPHEVAYAFAKAAKAAEVVTADDRKAVVFCEHMESVPYVASALQAAGLEVAQFTGASPRAAREKAVASLQTGSASALVTTIAAGGVGLTLTAASRVVFFEPVLDVASFRQAIGRCHRIGQKRSVAVCVLACEGTHEHVALELLTKRLAADDEMDQRVLKQRRLAKTFKLLG